MLVVPASKVPASKVFNIVRTDININASSTQQIPIQFVTPIEGRLIILLFPSTPVTATMSLTDLKTQSSFDVNINQGNPAYGEYTFDISRGIQINSITLTNNTSSAVSGYLIIMLEVE